MTDEELDAKRDVEYDMKCRMADTAVDNENYVECSRCGDRWFRYRDLHNGVCINCLEKLATPERAMKLGSFDEQSIELNGYLMQMFDKKQIEEILLEALKNSNSKAYVDYCMYDTHEFAKSLEDEGEL